MNGKMAKALRRMGARKQEQRNFLSLPHQIKGLVRQAYITDRQEHEDSGKMSAHICSLRMAFNLAAGIA